MTKDDLLLKLKEGQIQECYKRAITLTESPSYVYEDGQRTVKVFQLKDLIIQSEFKFTRSGIKYSHPEIKIFWMGILVFHFDPRYCDVYGYDDLKCLRIGNWGLVIRALIADLPQESPTTQQTELDLSFEPFPDDRGFRFAEYCSQVAGEQCAR